MLTGVRGVGKTTTARILARALNYSMPGKIDQPTIDLTELGEHCAAIMEGRHVDVIEMDAASNTGIDDIREIIEAVALRAGRSARYKVYIIDEVHMLSTAGLQRPAEDARRAARACEVHLRHDRDPQGAGHRPVALPALRPAPHRCRTAGRPDQRIVAARKASRSTTRRWRMIARAAEGSVRDACRCSIRRSPMAPAPSTAEAGARHARPRRPRARHRPLRRADGGRCRRRAGTTCKCAVRRRRRPGRRCSTDLAEFTHLVTRLKLVPTAAEDACADRGRARRAAATSPRSSRCARCRAPGRCCSRASRRCRRRDRSPPPRWCWSGLPTPPTCRPGRGAAGAARRQPWPGPYPLPRRQPLVRPASTAGQSSPGSSAASALSSRPGKRDKAAGGCLNSSRHGDQYTSAASARFCRCRKLWRSTPAGRAARPGSRERPAPAQKPVRVGEAPPLPARAIWPNAPPLPSKSAIFRLRFPSNGRSRLVNFEPGRIEFQPTPDADKDLAGMLGRKLSDWTGTRWIVAVSRTQGRPTLHEEREANQRQMRWMHARNRSSPACLPPFPERKWSTSA